MKAVHITLLVYCALATLVIIVLITLNARVLADMRSQTSELSSQAEAARSLQHSQDVETARLEANQRRERAGFTGEQAVVASLEVQAAQERSAEARTACERLETELTAQQLKLQEQRLRYLPLWILLLVHIIGGLAVLPYLRPKL